MKKIIYEGLSSKCFILSITSLEDHAYDVEHDKKSYEWFVKKYIQNVRHYGGSVDASISDYMLNNIKPVHVESQPVVFDERNMYLHSSVVSFKLPERTSHDILYIISNNGFSLEVEGTDDWTPGRMMSIKMMAGMADISHRIFIRKDLNVNGMADNYRSWFRQRAAHNARTKFRSSVLGFSTDNVGYGKYIGNNRYGYGTLPQFNIKVSIYDNIADAINEKEGFWFASSFLLAPFQDFGVYRCGIKIRLHAELINDTLIVSDNVNGYASIREKLISILPSIGLRDIITVNQFSIVQNNNIGALLNATPTGGCNMEKPTCFTLSLMLLNKNKIISVRDDSSPRRMNMIAKYGKDPKKATCQLYTQIYYSKNSNSTEGIIIPFEKGQDYHIKTLDFLKEYYTLVNEETRKQAVNNYIYKLVYKIQDEHNDVLMSWFKMCSATAQTDEEKLKIAYTQLKDGLIKEYQDIEKYLAVNDIGKKKPIPAIRLGDALERSPMNKISFQFDIETIRAINYRELDTPIKSRMLNIKYYIPSKSHGEKVMLQGIERLDRLYNKEENTIELNSKVLIDKYIERMRG